MIKKIYNLILNIFETEHETGANKLEICTSLADPPPGQVDTTLRARYSDTYVAGSFLALKATRRNESETIKRVGPFSIKQSTRVFKWAPLP